MSPRRPSVRALVLGALALAGVAALVVAPHASTAPDGLRRVAAEHGIDSGERDNHLDAGPLAGYRLFGDGGAVATGLAGVAGIACCFLAVTGLVALRRRRAATNPPAGVAPAPPATAAEPAGTP
jgi:hypothetical protein